MSTEGYDRDKIIELSELAGGLAHEIRNPLSTLKLNLQLLSEDLRGDPDDEHDMDPGLRRRTLQRLETLRSEADRLEHLLTGFLGLVGRHELSVRRVDLNDVVRHLRDFFAPSAEKCGIHMEVKLSPEALACELDDALIKQALLNLCLNAQQAMPGGGDLLITTRAEGAHAVVEVADSGCGIEPQVRDKLFKPFFSTKKEGTGLGLSLTRRIILEHDGAIDVESSPGKGSRFIVRLPLAARA